MNDTRLERITALLGDARGLLADIVSESPSKPEDRMALDGIRSSLNEALRQTNVLNGGRRDWG